MPLDRVAFTSKNPAVTEEESRKGSRVMYGYFLHSQGKKTTILIANKRDNVIIECHSDDVRRLTINEQEWRRMCRSMYQEPPNDDMEVRIMRATASPWWPQLDDARNNTDMLNSVWGNIGVHFRHGADVSGLISLPTYVSHSICALHTAANCTAHDTWAISSDGPTRVSGGAENKAKHAWVPNCASSMQALYLFARAGKTNKPVDEDDILKGTQRRKSHKGGRFFYYTKRARKDVRHKKRSDRARIPGHRHVVGRQLEGN